MKFKLESPIPEYAWPGGYPIFYICKDSGILCPDCVKRNEELIRVSIAYDQNTGWEIVASDINWEDNNLYCDNCNNKIESAYGGEE